MIRAVGSLLKDGRGAKRLAIALSVIAWSGVVLQLLAFAFNLRKEPNPILETADWYFSFFTNITNLGLAVLITIIALNVAERPSSRRVASSLAAAFVVYIIVVGVIYVLFLRPKNGLTGLSLIADTIMHYVMPIAYPIFWLKFVRKCDLKPAQSWYWILYPLTYAILTLLRGRITGWYPYPFIDASHLGYPLVLVTVIAFTLLFKVLGLAVVWIDSRLKAE